MVRWGKKNDGFEWHKYVRTTILVRRENRRQKLDDARQAAVDGLKVAGEGLKDAGLRGAEAGAQAAEKGAHAAGQGLKSAGSGTLAGLDWLGQTSAQWLSSAAAFSMQAMQRTYAFAAQWCGWAGYWLRVGLESAACQRSVLPLLVIGLAAVAGSAFLFYLRAVDQEAIAALAIGIISLGTASATYLLSAAPLFTPSKNKKKRKNKPVTSSFSGQVSSLLGAVQSGLSWPSGLRARQVGGGLIALSLVGLLGWAASTLNSKRLDFSGLFAVEPTVARETVAGRGRVVWGDTLRVEKKTIRLSGIEAPERGQRCSRPGARRWRCGPAARSALRRLIGRKTITCQVSKSDTASRYTGDCKVGGKNIAGELVKRGYVFAVRGLLAPYASEEKIARDKKLGIWRGQDQQRPEDYRAQRWQEASRKAPDGCPIKGRVSRAGRIYLLPWSDRYTRTKVRQRRGERWFCSEEDAVAAGWRRSDNS